MSREDVEFKTIDGVTLRGSVWRASKRGPGIVICPGVSLAETPVLISTATD